jgi:hypothetical protein
MIKNDSLLFWNMMDTIDNSEKPIPIFHLRKNIIDRNTYECIGNGGPFIFQSDWLNITWNSFITSLNTSTLYLYVNNATSLFGRIRMIDTCIHDMLKNDHQNISPLFLLQTGQFKFANYTLAHQLSKLKYESMLDNQKIDQNVTVRFFFKINVNVHGEELYYPEGMTFNDGPNRLVTHTPRTELNINHLISYIEFRKENGDVIGFGDSNDII